MSKYLRIGLALAIFAAVPALAATIHRSTKQSTQNLRVSAAAPSQGATTRAGIAGKLHNSVGVPELDCVQHAFGIDIALAC